MRRRTLTCTMSSEWFRCRRRTTSVAASACGTRSHEVRRWSTESLVRSGRQRSCEQSAGVSATQAIGAESRYTCLRLREPQKQPSSFCTAAESLDRRVE